MKLLFQTVFGMLTANLKRRRISKKQPMRTMKINTNNFEQPKRLNMQKYSNNSSNVQQKIMLVCSFPYRINTTMTLFLKSILILFLSPFSMLFSMHSPNRVPNLTMNLKRIFYSSFLIFSQASRSVIATNILMNGTQIQERATY